VITISFYSTIPELLHAKFPGTHFIVRVCSTQRKFHNVPFYSHVGKSPNGISRISPTLFLWSLRILLITYRFVSSKVGANVMTQSVAIKVIVADDHPLIRLGICKILDGLPDIQIVGEATNGRETIEHVNRDDPDILLLDLQMPVMDGFQVLEELQRRGSKVRVLVISANDDSALIAEVFSLGAWGYYIKDDAPAMIATAIRQAVCGEGRGTRPPSIKLKGSSIAEE
jgi:CheY-like chemotaxis protein